MPTNLEWRSGYTVQAEQGKKRNLEPPLYLVTAVVTLRETSHPACLPSSDYPKKTAASNTQVEPEIKPVKKEALELQA